jgi:hypothetical protein
MPDPPNPPYRFARIPIEAKYLTSRYFRRILFLTGPLQSDVNVGRGLSPKCNSLRELGI